MSTRAGRAAVAYVARHFVPVHDRLAVRVVEVFEADRKRAREAART